MKVARLLLFLIVLALGCGAGVLLWQRVLVPQYGFALESTPAVSRAVRWATADESVQVFLCADGANRFKLTVLAPAPLQITCRTATDERAATREDSVRGATGVHIYTFTHKFASDRERLTLLFAQEGKLLEELSRNMVGGCEQVIAAAPSTAKPKPMEASPAEDAPGGGH